MPALTMVEGRRQDLVYQGSEEAPRAFYTWDSVFTWVEPGCGQFLSSQSLGLCLDSVPSKQLVRVYAPFHSSM